MQIYNRKRPTLSKNCMRIYNRKRPTLFLPRRLQIMTFAFQLIGEAFFMMQESNLFFYFIRLNYWSLELLAPRVFLTKTELLLLGIACPARYSAQVGVRVGFVLAWHIFILNSNAVFKIEFQALNSFLRLKSQNSKF